MTLLVRRRRKPTRTRQGEGPASRQRPSWLLKQIHEWRWAAGNRQRIDGQTLNDVLHGLEAAGLPTGLPGYVVLGCEWLFRLRDFGPQDVDRFLGRIQSSLSEVVGANEAGILTDVLAPGIRKRLRRHRQLAAVLEWTPPAMSPFAVSGPEVRPNEPLIPVRRGPAPWLTPWVAGLIIERLLEGKGVRGRQLALALIEVERGDVDEKDFRLRRGALLHAVEPSEGNESVFDRLVGEFKQLYELIGSQEPPPPFHWPDDWEEVVRQRLEVLGPFGTFPFHLPVIQALYSAYRSSYRSSPHQRVAKNSS